MIVQGLDDNLMKHTVKSATLQSTNCVLSQSWRPDTTNHRLSHAVTTLLKYSSAWKLRLNTHKTEIILLPKRPPNPWASAVRYLGLVLHSKLLYTQHLHTVANKATGVQCNNFPRFIARPVQQVNPLHITHSIHSNVLRSCLQFHSSNYLKLPIIQSKCFRVTGNYPRRTPTFHLHDSL
jgi:hypothetical protein